MLNVVSCINCDSSCFAFLGLGFVERYASRLAAFTGRDFTMDALHECLFAKAPYTDLLHTVN
jgi:hypothetical protein